MATPWKPVTIPPPSRSARMPVPTERGVDACRFVELPMIGIPRGNLNPEPTENHHA